MSEVFNINKSHKDCIDKFKEKTLNNKEMLENTDIFLFIMALGHGKHENIGTKLGFVRTAYFSQKQGALMHAAVLANVRDDEVNNYKDIHDFQKNAEELCFCGGQIFKDLLEKYNYNSEDFRDELINKCNTAFLKNVEMDI